MSESKFQKLTKSLDETKTKAQELAREATKSVLTTFTEVEKNQLLKWAHTSLEIRNSRDLSKPAKILELTKHEFSGVGKLLVQKVSKYLKENFAVNESLKSGVAILGFSAGLEIGTTALGIAAIGLGAGVPILILSEAGETVLNAVIFEIQNSETNHIDNKAS